MTSIDTISQGTKFIYNDNIYVKLCSAKDQPSSGW